MKTLELLAPAGSPEAVVAAVQNGANAVYLGVGDFNARRNAKNFTEEELEQAVKYCRARGVKVHVTLNTLVTDRELLEVEKTVRKLNNLQVDAIIVADLGIARMIRQMVPDLPIHASTQMTVHNLDGVKRAAEHGFTRVVLSRELSRDEIRKICAESPIEIEVFAHGALCMCYSGQCYFSGVVGKRSGNRGLCAQPCRLSYRLGDRMDDAHLLSLKDLCLAEYLHELREMGVCSIKIEGRMKRPEYVAAVIRTYANLLREDRAPSRDEMEFLERVFSREGFTDGYYTNHVDAEMFGTRIEENAAHTQAMYKDLRKTYQGEKPTLGIRFYCVIKKDKPTILAAEDTEGLRHIVQGPVPEVAVNHPLDAQTVREQLRKTGGTPFGYQSAKVLLDEGLMLPLSALNAMRRECTEELMRQRMYPPRRPCEPFRPGIRLVNEDLPVKYTVSVLTAEQVTEELLRHQPEFLMVPLSEMVKNLGKLGKWSAYTKLCAMLPRIIREHETQHVAKQLQAVYDRGVRHAMVGNIGHIDLVQKFGFTLHGDFGLNVFNSQTVRELKQDGFESLTLSPELSFAQIRDISKGIHTEILAYGRLQLMLLEHCVVKNTLGNCACATPQHLTDRTGTAFPLVRDGDTHRNVILNAQKLFLADKKRDYTKIGISYARLMFTTEHPKECVNVYERYLGMNDFKPPIYTRGLYYRGVE
ncbi:MAG: U32 family peptidase [Ruminococcaceae bacterium]|nr:U32 family peptidase [Oscillospiraceae bacterium]